MSAVETLTDALFGNPPSPTMKPSREGVLAAFTELSTAVTAAASDAVAYPTIADLPEGAAKGSRARVYDDEVASNNTYWIVRDGGWAIDVDYISSIADVVQPLVDDAEAAATAAQEAAATIYADPANNVGYGPESLGGWTGPGIEGAAGNTVFGAMAGGSLDRRVERMST